MHLIRRTAVLAVASMLCVTARAEIPNTVAERLERAVNPSAPGEFQGSYTLTASTMVQHPNGKKREDVVFETAVVVAADGSRTRRLVRYLENGEDVTEDQRAVFESAAQPRPDDGDNDDDSDLANPYGETADLYLFGEPERRGAEVVVAFEPAPGREQDANLAVGRVAWNAETLVPAWMEMTAVHPPKPLKRLAVRVEYSQRDDEIFVTRIVTDGLARVVLMQREFRTDLRFADILPAGEPSDS